MESITKFLDPKNLPGEVGDQVDIEKEAEKQETLADQEETDNETDTVEVNVSVQGKSDSEKSTEKPKTPVKSVTLPGKMEPVENTPPESLGDEGESKAKEADTSKESEKEESKTNSEKEESKTDSKEEKAEESKDEEGTEPEDDGAQEESEPLESGEREFNYESDSESLSDSSDSESLSDEETESDSESSDSELIDQGQNDLEVNQETQPLLKLAASYEYQETAIYELPNLAKIVYVHRPSELCLVKFSFKVGSYFEDDSNRGISHLLEHLMFNGYPGMSSLEFNAKMDSLGMKVNAYTSRLETCFHFNGLKVNFIPAYDLYSNLLNSFTLTQEALDKERGVVLNEIGVYQDDNWSVLSEAIHSNAYRQHPVAYPILGYDAVIERLNLDQVQSWYNDNYNSENLTLYLVGEFAEEDLIFAASKLSLFRNGNRNVDPVITDAMCLPFYKNVIARKEGITQTLIDSILPIKNEGFNLYCSYLLSQILGGSMSSYLWKEFRESRSIAYQVGSYSSNMDPEHLNVHFYAGLNSPDDAEVAKKIFKDAVVYAKTISEEEFNRGFNSFLVGVLKDDEKMEGVLGTVEGALYHGIDLDEYVRNGKNLTYQAFQTFVQQLDENSLVTGILYPM